MLRSSLRAYIAAVLRQWWTYAGIVSGLVGYLLDLFTGLTIPPVAWLAVFAGCFVVASFMAYHDVRVALALRDRGLQVPQWAMHACLANSEGAWLTALVIGDAPKQKFDTTRHRGLVAAIDEHFGLSEASRSVESRDEFLRVTTPKGAFTPELQVQLGAGQHGALCVQVRTQADPLSLLWVLQQLDRMMAFLLSDASEAVVSRKRREYTLCLNAWPEGGIDVGNLVTAHRLSQSFVRGGRTMESYKLAKHDREGWGAIRAFASKVLAYAGWTEFEPNLAMVTRYSLAAIVEGGDVEVQRRDIAND